MKLLLAITMMLMTAAHSSGREQGAAIDERVQTKDELCSGGSGFPPGAMVLCQAEADTTSTFATIHIFIDPQGKPLGAYQFELTSADVSFKVLGVEAGEHPAFDHGRPPYFDPVVQQDGTDRLIIAEYAMPDLDAEQLPTQQVRIASVGVLFDRPIDGNEPPAIDLTLITAGDADGKKIDATLSHTLQIPERPE